MSRGRAAWVSRGDLPGKVGTRFETSSSKGKGKKDQSPVTGEGMVWRLS